MFALTWPAASAMSSIAAPLSEAIETKLCLTYVQGQDDVGHAALAN
jgi:hypothetical protein